MKKKILIPILTGIATVSAIAPIAALTSCANSNAYHDQIKSIECRNFKLLGTSSQREAQLSFELCIVYKKLVQEQTGDPIISGYTTLNKCSKTFSGLIGERGETKEYKFDGNSKKITFEDKGIFIDGSHYFFRLEFNINFNMRYSINSNWCVIDPIFLTQPTYNVKILDF